MKFLLDSHVLVWFFEDPEKLRKSTIEIIEDPDNDILISTVVIAELMIKISRGKLKVDFDLKKAIKSNEIKYLPITADHAYCTETLPWIHKDPFDRLQIAQAISEKIPLITSDSQIHKYDFHFIKA